MKAKLLLFISVLWQFPQTVLGIILCVWYFRRIKHIFPCGTGVIVRVEGFPGGISLGNVIIVATGSDPKTIKHECGHATQSLYLGWLYLFIIGIPSVFWAMVWRPSMGSYYQFYTEAWANRLGGVKR